MTIVLAVFALIWEFSGKDQRQEELCARMVESAQAEIERERADVAIEDYTFHCGRIAKVGSSGNPAGRGNHTVRYWRGSVTGQPGRAELPAIHAVVEVSRTRKGFIKLSEVELIE